MKFVKGKGVLNMMTMKRFKRQIAVGLGMCMMATMITGCSVNSFFQKDDSSGDLSDYASKTVMGKITKIDGSKVTIALYESSGDNGTKASGTPDQQPSGSGKPDMPQGSGKPDMPDGSAMPQGSGTPQMSEGSSVPQSTGSFDPSAGGERGMGGGKQGGGFSESGETITITISDESVIQAGDSSASTGLAALTTDSMIRVTFDADANVTGVSVMGGRGNNQNDDQNNNQNSTNASVTPAPTQATN